MIARLSFWLIPLLVAAGLEAAPDAPPHFLAPLHKAAEPNGGQTRILRSPTVSAMQIAFAYANNIWIVEKSGGLARLKASPPRRWTTEPPPPTWGKRTGRP